MRSNGSSLSARRSTACSLGDVAYGSFLLPSAWSFIGQRPFLFGSLNCTPAKNHSTLKPWKMENPFPSQPFPAASRGRRLRPDRQRPFKIFGSSRRVQSGVLNLSPASVIRTFHPGLVAGSCVTSVSQ
jgi:hypothetical protein